MTEELPKSIFKYEPPTVRAIANLNSHSVYFNSPDNFNDPFDSCMTRFVAKDLVLRHIQEQGKPSLPAVKGGLWLHNQKRSVCCFCKESNNILLWSHYSQHHTGFCLEFDKTKAPFSTARPVDYTGTIPSLETLKTIPTNQVVEVLGCIKAKDWEYEGELRIFIHADPALHAYPPAALLAVHFGARIDPAVRDLICLIAARHNPNIKFFVMKLNDQRIQLDAYPHIFTPS